MSPPRFYCPQLATSPKLTSARTYLDPAEAKHATSVLRLREEDVVALFDGEGRRALARVIEARRDKLGVEVTEWLNDEVSSQAEVTLAIALPKGDRQRTLVDAATELGVSHFIPLLTQRCVAQPTDNALERLKRQVIEACKQCGRDRLMKVSHSLTLDGLIEATGCNQSQHLVAHPYDVVGPRSHLTTHLTDRARSTVLAIGPEGGFTDNEVTQLANAGWKVVDLGPLVLRIEVAAIASVAQVMGWYHRQP